jgi:hypothetical protein
LGVGHVWNVTMPVWSIVKDDVDWVELNCLGIQSARAHASFRSKKFWNVG